MKNLLIKGSACIAVTVCSVLVFNTKESKATEPVNRHFFQITSTYDDGAMTRWTDCVNTGGMCWSEESSVVADCSFDGGETWTDCNRQDSIDPGN